MLSNQTFETLFAGSFSRNPDVTCAIIDTSAPLPTEKLRLDVAAVAEWLLAVVDNHTVRANNMRAKDKAVHRENSKARQLPLPRFDAVHREPLHSWVVFAVGNALIMSDPGAIQKIKAFLKAQTKRQVAVPATDQLMHCSS